MGTEDYLIRKARLSDVDAVVACIEEAYAIYTNRISDLPSVSDGVEQEIAENRIWVASDRDKIIGCVILVMEDGYVKLANLAVHPDHNGKGVGSKLMGFSESEAMNRGYGEMRLNTHAAMPENVKLYIHLGWHETGRNGNAVQMRKYLKS